MSCVRASGACFARVSKRNTAARILFIKVLRDDALRAPPQDERTSRKDRLSKGTNEGH